MGRIGRVERVDGSGDCGTWRWEDCTIFSLRCLSWEAAMKCSGYGHLEYKFASLWNSFQYNRRLFALWRINVWNDTDNEYQCVPGRRQTNERSCIS